MLQRSGTCGLFLLRLDRDSLVVVYVTEVWYLRTLFITLEQRQSGSCIFAWGLGPGGPFYHIQTETVWQLYIRLGSGTGGLFLSRSDRDSLRTAIVCSFNHFF